MERGTKTAFITKGTAAGVKVVETTRNNLKLFKRKSTRKSVEIVTCVV